MNNRTKFAVQPLWSNKAFDATGQGCVRSASDQSPRYASGGHYAARGRRVHDHGYLPARVRSRTANASEHGVLRRSVEVNPKIYLVYWAGATGAFDHTGQSASILMAWCPD